MAGVVYTQEAEVPASFPRISIDLCHGLWHLGDRPVDMKEGQFNAVCAAVDAEMTAHPTIKSHVMPTWAEVLAWRVQRDAATPPPP